MDKDTALKLALEALQWHWGGEPLPTLELKAINAIKEALAQSDDLTIAYMAGFYDGKNKYAPRREWVGLTEEDKNDCLVSADPCECLAKPESHQLMDDVEAKLREKNT